MTATNHVLTGVVIVTVVHNPVISLPLALVSHFALDVLPHFGDKSIGYDSYKYKLILGSDIYLATICLVLLLLLTPVHMGVLIMGGIIAAAPDLMWVPDFVAALRHRPRPAYGPIRKFHYNIQRYQRPKGALLELAWFITAFIVAFGYSI